MRKLDNRGVAAFEFCLVAVAFFTLVFAIFDLGCYAITMQSLRHLAGAAARAMMIQCYTPAVTSNNSPSGCTGDYLSSTEKQNAAPFLYAGGASPTLATTSGGGMLTVTASIGFTPVMPIWGTSLNAPSASTQVPFTP
ncbi:TadE family protein [Bradyrhizobium iriomotense]|uniref:TadE family protein n=1 Tax=Bradyrhizobium iriomotense TaxID=441950 RepID=UPI001FE7FF55|nr:TadE family protein [Bradyrhizobium iriomotense]